MRHLLVVTGANGALGRAIIVRALERYDGEVQLVAAVRSERAAAQVPPMPQDRGRIERISYEDPESIQRACEGATALVHLPGVLVEHKGATYETAHVGTTQAAIAAARGVRKFVLLSAIDADPGSSNRYFRTKGEAEEIVRRSGLDFTVLRAPLLLGPHTEGARGLLRATRSGNAWLLGGGETWHQPMDVGDLAEGVLHTALDPELAKNLVLDVAGPARLHYRDLVEMAARLRGTYVRVRRVPVLPLRWLLRARGWFSGPGFSPDALEVLLTDTMVDAETAARTLGIALSSLEASLRRSFLLPGGV